MCGYLYHPKVCYPGTEGIRLPQFNYVPRTTDARKEGTIFLPNVPSPLVGDQDIRGRLGRGS